MVFVVGQTSGCVNRLGKARKPISQQRAAQRAARVQSVEPVDPSITNRSRPVNAAMQKLAKQVGASIVPLQNPCVEGSSRSCYRQSLDRTFLQLDTLVDNPERNVRILHLGDSHIAGDYISGTIREELQKTFGDAGRGFVHIEQKAPYGGRRLKRSGPWKRARIVDQGQAGRPFGFSGMSFESFGADANLEYRLDDESRVTLHFYANPRGPEVSLSVNGQYIGSVDTYAKSNRTKSKSFSVPRRAKKDGKDRRILRIRARASGARLFGISYTKKRKGILYDAIGPVGADARVYLSLERRSFVEHLQLLKPDLVIIMLGGNDALRVRKGRASIATIGKEHQQLVELVQYALPESDCMLWSPMDAGEMKNGRIVSKSHISEIRHIQEKVAIRKGCSFWDMYEAMGEDGAVKRWSRKKIMNKDLVHPRRRAGELLGYLFSEAFMRSYDQAD